MSEDRLEALISGLAERIERIDRTVSEMSEKLETIISHEVRLTQVERDVLALRTDKRELWREINTVKERCISREKEVELVHALDKRLRATPTPQGWWDSKVSRSAERVLALIAGGAVSWLLSNWRW